MGVNVVYTDEAGFTPLFMARRAPKHAGEGARLQDRVIEGLPNVQAKIILGRSLADIPSPPDGYVMVNPTLLGRLGASVGLAEVAVVSVKERPIVPPKRGLFRRQPAAAPTLRTVEFNADPKFKIGSFSIFPERIVASAAVAATQRRESGEEISPDDPMLWAEILTADFRSAVLGSGQIALYGDGEFITSRILDANAPYLIRGQAA